MMYDIENELDDKGNIIEHSEEVYDHIFDSCVLPIYPTKSDMVDMQRRFASKVKLLEQIAKEREEKENDRRVAEGSTGVDGKVSKTDRDDSGDTGSESNKHEGEKEE